MLISANIPPNKVSNKQFINFMRKYTNRSFPTESTLRKKCLASCYEDSLRRVRDIIGDKKIWVSIDELTDVASRCAAMGLLAHSLPLAQAIYFFYIQKCK